MEIELPDYKKIASQIKRKKISVEEKEIEAALKWLQRSRAKFTFKAQSAQIGDFIEIEYWLPESKEPIKDAFILGEGRFIPGFEEKLIGMKANEIKKEPSLKIKMKSVQNIELAELTDEFAKGLGNFENLTTLKKSIKERIFLEKEQAESIRVRNEILEKINIATALEVPEILVEKEKNALFENFKKNLENLKISFKDYLAKIRKTEKEILDSFLNLAQKRVKNFLILKEIGKRECIDQENLKDYNKEALTIEKTFQFLENLVPKL